MTQQEIDSLLLELDDAQDCVKILSKVIQDTFWMARRYALGRHTYAPAIVNDSLALLNSVGVSVQEDHTLVADGNSSPSVLDIV